MVLAAACGGNSSVQTAKGRDGLSVNVSDIQEPVCVFKTSVELTTQVLIL